MENTAENRARLDMLQNYSEENQGHFRGARREAKQVFREKKRIVTTKKEILKDTRKFRLEFKGERIGFNVRAVIIEDEEKFLIAHIEEQKKR